MGEKMEYQRRVGVFWDVENCGIPLEMPGSVAADRIRSAVKHFGELVELNAYGDISLFRIGCKHKGLRTAGVCFIDTPHESRKQVADMRIIADIIAFALDQSKPATVILISCDGDFAHAISLIQDRGHAAWIISNNLRTSKKLLYLADGTMSWKYDVLDRIYSFSDPTNISSYTDDEDELDEEKEGPHHAHDFSNGFGQTPLSAFQPISSRQTSSLSFCATQRTSAIQTCFSPVCQYALCLPHGLGSVISSSLIPFSDGPCPVSSSPPVSPLRKHPPQWRFFHLIKFLRERRAVDPENQEQLQRCEVAHILQKRDPSIFASYKSPRIYLNEAAAAGVITYVRVGKGKPRLVQLHPDYY